MQAKHFTVLSLTLAGIVSAHGLFADTFGQTGSTEPIKVSKNLQWKRLPPKSGAASETAAIPARAQNGAIQQVQLRQPIKPPTMTPAQRDTVYPELRPQDRTVPGGATLEPTAPPTIGKARAETLNPVETPTENRRQTTVEKARPSTHYTDTPAKTIEKAPETITAAPLPLPEKTEEDVSVKSKAKGVHCPDEAGFKSIRDITVDIRPNTGELPEECPLITTTYTGRHFGRTCLVWKASAVCTKGAYFEDVQLERYGHTICPVLQPVISGAKFFATVPLLPYKMGITPPNECVYTLGYYRPGSCSPYMLDPFPISVRAVAFEALAVGGAVAVIP